ncbi:GT2 family glycosyltransferase [Flavobacterium sp. PL11]|uniref:glycosyltransferase n=1 Tax=Flavobacterium sp. PL11 TaxID=3071717 RepID=UPI002E0903F3|nr:GT2 family glycosyltransferase [Flavobacterium sp. PL11]
MKLLSVIIVTYNSQNLIEKCLDNLILYNDLNEDLEIIIVDNSDFENNAILFDLIKIKYPKDIILIKNDRNGGYGQGNNIGIKEAKGKYIAIMNPDITMTEPLFRDAISKFLNNPNLSLIGYKQIGGSDLSFYINPENFIPILDSLMTIFFNKINYFNNKYMFLSGAYFFTTSEAFKAINYFDENLFLYCEEPDITRRILTIKQDIIFENKKSYIHEIDDRKLMTDNSFRNLMQSTNYYLKKFSFSRTIYFKRKRIELKIKKFIFSILGNKKNVEIINRYLNMIESIIKKIT